METVRQWHGWWMTLIAMNRSGILGSFAGWKRGRITFMVSPIICPVCTAISYDILELAVLEGCPITLDYFDPMNLHLKPHISWKTKLSLVAMLGYYVQLLVVGGSCLIDWAQQMTDP